MIEFRKHLDEVLEIVKASDSEKYKFTIYAIGDRISTIIENGLDEIYNKCEKELEKIKDELNKICNENNNLIYDENDRKIINNKIHENEDGKWVMLDLSKEGDYEYELELIKSNLNKNKLVNDDVKTCISDTTASFCCYNT